MNLSLQEKLTYTPESDGGRTARVSCAHCGTNHDTFQREYPDGWSPPLALTMESCGWRLSDPKSGSQLCCSPTCYGALRTQGAAGSLPFTITGEEQERRQSAAGTIGALERIARDASRLTAVRVRCSRCTASYELDAADGPSAIVTLTALGWHRHGGAWACSKTCLEWMTTPSVPAPVVPVLAVNDASYQARRAVLNRHGYQPGDPPATAARKGVR